MKSLLVRAICGAAFSVFASGAMAQDSTNRVALQTDWSVFSEESPKECWGVSPPRETVNTRDGQPVTVQRSDILLFVTFRPGSPGEVSFTGGYPFAPSSTVSVDIGGTVFEFITDAEFAWPSDPTQDAAVIEALKRGSAATLTARSARGTQTKDTFSLRGFTAAVQEAQNRCK